MEHFPAPAVPEVAFLGRSNVGKSSVINSLLGAKIAKTSSTPGRTRSINFFEVRWPGKPNPDVVFADLPGYGYSRVPREILEYLRSAERPFLMVGTKADKLSGNTLRKSLDAFTQEVPDLRIVPYSARTGLGRDELWREIRSAAESHGKPGQRAMA